MYVNAWKNISRIYIKLKTVVASGESRGFRGEGRRSSLIWNAALNLDNKYIYALVVLLDISF